VERKSKRVAGWPLTNSNDTGGGADTKRHPPRQLRTGHDRALGELLEGGVRGEADGRVGTLAQDLFRGISDTPDLGVIDMMANGMMGKGLPQVPDLGRSPNSPPRR
jgi:hypothetical protein